MVLAQAFTRAGDNPETILSQLLRRTEQVAERLATASEGDERDSLNRSLAFCLALSQSAAAFRQLILDARPPHPHRR